MQPGLTGISQLHSGSQASNQPFPMLPAASLTMYPQVLTLCTLENSPCFCDLSHSKDFYWSILSTSQELDNT